MENEFRRFAFDAYLTEYKSARDEYVMLLKQRENMLFLSLVITGALVSFYFGGAEQPAAAKDDRILSIYMVVPLCMITGARWLELGWRARCIDVYVGDVLATRMNAVLKACTLKDEALVQPVVFGGTQEATREFSKTESLSGLVGIIHRFVYYGCFLAPGLFSQWFVFDRGTGDFWHRLTHLPFPVIYYANWVMLATYVCLPILRLFGVRFLTPRPGLL